MIILRFIFLFWITTRAGLHASVIQKTKTKQNKTQFSHALIFLTFTCTKTYKDKDYIKHRRKGKT